LIYPVSISQFTVVKAKGKLFYVTEVSSSFTLKTCQGEMHCRISTD